MEKNRIRDGKKSDPGWKTFGSGIRDKHPGSATLHFKHYQFDCVTSHRKLWVIHRNSRCCGAGSALIRIGLAVLNPDPDRGLCSVYEVGTQQKTCLC